MILIYLVPDNSVYHRDESFTELFQVLQRIYGSGYDGYLVGDQNGRMGKLEFSDKYFEDNVDEVSNPQGILLKSIYNKCAFYPVNHLIVDENVYPGVFTYIKGDKKSQIDFFCTNNHINVRDFLIEEKSLGISDHKYLHCKIRVNLSLSTQASFSWAKDSNVVGSIHKESVFRVRFTFDEGKLYAEMANKTKVLEHRLSTGSIHLNDVIPELTEHLQTAFKNCKTGRSPKTLCDNYNNLSGKDLWEKLDWSGKLSSTVNHDSPDDEETLKFFKCLYGPPNEPSIDNFVADNLYIPITDDPISMDEIKDAFKQQKKGYNFSQNTLYPVRNILFSLVYAHFNVIFFAENAVRWAPSLLFKIPKKAI